jgi:hypothetical protein
MGVPGQSARHPARRARDLSAASPEPASGGRARAHRRRTVGLRRPVGRGRLRGRGAVGVAHPQHRHGPDADRRGIGIGVFVGGGCCAGTSAAGPTPGCTASSSGSSRCATPRWRPTWAVGSSSPARAGGPRGASAPAATPHELRLLRPRGGRHAATGGPSREPIPQRGHAPAGAREDPAPGCRRTVRGGAAARRGLVECAQEPDHPRAAGPALGQHPQVVGRAAGERLCLHVLHLAAGPALANQWRGGLPAQPARAVQLFHAELPGLPAAGLRVPARQRRAAPARARHLRDSGPRLRRRPGIARQGAVRPTTGSSRWT